MVPAGSVELQRWQGKTGPEITDLIMVHDAGQDRSPFAASEGSDFKRQATEGASVAGVGVLPVTDSIPLPGGAVTARCLFGCSGMSKGSTAPVPPAVLIHIDQRAQRRRKKRRRAVGPGDCSSR